MQQNPGHKIVIRHFLSALERQRYTDRLEAPAERKNLEKPAHSLRHCFCRQAKQVGMLGPCSLAVGSGISREIYKQTDRHRKLGHLQKGKTKILFVKPASVSISMFGIQNEIG